ncbi:MAG: hypothetical protein AB7I50_07280 [Vicinamibacterales bacterium]
MAAKASVRRPVTLVVLVVAVALAGALRALDHVAPWLRDEPRGTERFSSLDALEREVGTQLILPIFFPDVLEWPPAGVYRAPGTSRPTSVVFHHRATGAPGLVVAQCLDGECDIPARLLPAGTIREGRRIELGGAIARLVYGRDWRDEYIEVSAVRFDRRVVVRLYGEDAATLLRVARSLRRGRP